MPYAIDFREYFDYAALTRHLRGLAAAYPALAALTSLGQSFQGREIWRLTLTNAATGPDADKPAYYIDGGIHAEEVATTSAALYAAWYLLENYGSDAESTWLLDHLTFYVIPRINPDGQEISLTTAHHWCGNGRYLPGEEQTRGLCQHDIDGNGLIVQMRLEDPAGEWKVSERDPRLMARRDPGDVGGTYYRLYPEGEIRGDWDGAAIEIERPRDGNLNRNFPAGWRPEFRQYGAGDLPLSEPESKAIADFILAHPNIAGMMCYHTHGGVHLRPSLVEPDSALPRSDLALYQTLGKLGTDLTGYPVISVYEEFTSDPDEPRVGSLMQWSYDEFGIPTFSTELWNPELAAGFAEVAKYQLRPRSEADELALLRYNDTHLGGKGFVAWTPFEHSQLGRVEIGGWTHMYTFRNPPPASLAATDEARRWLPDMLHANALFTFRLAAAAPLLSLTEVRADEIGAGLFRVRAVVSNQGFLPTNLTEMALRHHTASEVTVTLETGGEILIGQRETKLGHLAGRDERSATWNPWMRQWHATSQSVEWLIRAPEGTPLTLIASASKAGTQRQQVTL